MVIASELIPFFLAEGISFSIPKDIALCANPLSALTLSATSEISLRLGLAAPLTLLHL